MFVCALTIRIMLYETFPDHKPSLDSDYFIHQRHELGPINSLSKPQIPYLENGNSKHSLI